MIRKPTMSHRSPSFRYSTLCAAVALALPVAVQAQQGPVAAGTSKTAAAASAHYSIPAGPLSATLKAIGSISGKRIQFDEADVKGLNAPAIQDAPNEVAAVQAAVAGSGLTMASNPDGSLRVFVQQLAAVAVTAQRDEAETGFRASSSPTATRGGADLLDVPQSVTVLTAKVFETQQAPTVEDALRNVAGVITRPGAQGASSFTIRGFDTSNSTLANGLSDPNSLKTNIAGVERVEVLKGPQALLAGAYGQGGTLNIVTKKPTSEPIRNVTLSYGSRAERTATIDLAGPLNESKELSYRVIGSATRMHDNPGHYDGRTQNYGMAALRWKDARTDVIAGVSTDKSHMPPNLYTIAIRGFIEPTPTMRAGNPDNGVDIDSQSVYYSLEHSFTDALQFTSRMQRTATTQDLVMWTPQFPISTAGRILGFSPTNQRMDLTTLSGDHYLSYKFKTGPVDQRAVMGFNHSHGDNRSTEYSASQVAVPLFQPTQYPFPSIVRNNSTLFSNYSTETDQRGIYAQDTLKWEKWTLVGGVRRSTFDSGPTTIIYNAPKPPPQRTDKTTISKTTVNAGLIYNLDWNTSLYGSYGEGFSPLYADRPICSTGSRDVPPTMSKSKEVGVKSNVDDRFSWSAAVFQIDQINTLRRNVARNCYDLLDGQRSRGLELEASGKPMPGLNLIFNYTYLKQQNMSDPTQLPSAAPRTQVSAWSTYDFQSEPLRNLSVALGISAWTDARLGTRPTDPTSPGGARIDAGIAYAQPEWSVRLGVKNLANRTLYGYSTSSMYVPIYDKRTFMVTYQRKL